MISKFWNVLFKYADGAKEAGDMDKLQTVREIEDLLQQVYDDSKNHIKQTELNEKGAFGALMASVPGIKKYVDTSDGEVFYELDNLFFSTPKQVIDYIVECRRTITDLKNCMTALRRVSEHVEGQFTRFEKNSKAIKKKAKTVKEISGKDSE